MPRIGQQLHVVIAGGGVAGLEAAFALRALAGDRTRVTVVSPNEEFVYRPMSVAEPFSAGRAEHFPLRELVERAGAELVGDAVTEVDSPNRQIRTSHGAQLSYDALLVCLGTSVHARYEHASTVDDARIDELLHGLVQDIEGGYVHRLAIVVPAPVPWPLPAYEIALMAAERAWDMQAEMSVTLITPEQTPLAVFGDERSLALSALLEQRGIDVITSAYCDIPQARTIHIHPGDRVLKADRIVALPELRGPAMSGLPHDDVGFIPIDEHVAVRGAERVWAAGDATSYPVKHGGISAQMADTAARAIAALAGAAIEPRAFAPVLEGVLLTGGSPRHLRRHATGGDSTPPGLPKLERGDATPKIAAEYLAPHLSALGANTAPAAPATSLTA